MPYSIISVLGLVLNLIMNRDAINKTKLQPGTEKDDQQAVIRYSWFLIAANCYFTTDIAWGLLYDHHDNSALFYLLYIATVLYFFFLFLTMLTWNHYIVSYLNKKGRRSKALLYSAWSLFAVALVYLVINSIHPFIFSFNENREYVPEAGRHVAFILQVLLYVIISSHMFNIAHKSVGEEKIRHIAVGLTTAIMEIGLIAQLLNPNWPFYAMGLIVGICMMHSYVELSDKKEKEIYDNLARGLAEDYAAMYYVDIETGEYQEFVISQEYKSMGVPTTFRDFYAETQANIETFVHPDDQEMARTLHQKENMLANLEGKTTFSYKYRIMVHGEPRVFLFTLKRSKDEKHFVLYEKDIQNDIMAEAKRLENQKKATTFTQIAESLADNYDVLYYIDAKDSSYISFECRNIYGPMDARQSGDDYYLDSLKDIPRIVHPGDCDLVFAFLNKDNFSKVLKDKKSASIEYRIRAGNITHYVRLTARRTNDGSHYIVGIENIDDVIQREKQHLKALNTEKELARRDELTGVKNKTAYTELEKSLQDSIDKGEDIPPFAIVVCDANNLKKINDTEGHMSGDEYIKKTAILLCDIFSHSPVFRVGGDEFVIFLQGKDYSQRAELISRLRDQIEKNMQSKIRPIVASGISDYIPGTDTRVLQIFDRADKEMYENKQRIKAINDEI